MNQDYSLFYWNFISFNWKLNFRRKKKKLWWKAQL